MSERAEQVRAAAERLREHKAHRPHCEKGCPYYRSTNYFQSHDEQTLADAYLEHLAAPAGAEGRFRAGDIVKHGPTGETWALAIDQEGDEVMWYGWPEGFAKAADCTLVEAATDQKRQFMLEEVAKGNGARAMKAKLLIASPPTVPPPSSPR